MTFAEVIIFCLFLAFCYFLLRPLQRRLEMWIYRRITKSGSQKPVIEIKDYKKKN